MKRRSVAYYESKIGLKIGKLTFIKYSHRNDMHHHIVIRCDCGVEKTMRWQNFITGHQQSCGCLRKKIKNPFRHHPLYRVWTSLKQRCLDPQHTNYKYYGGKGVKICNDWLIYKNFYDWCLNNGWQKNMQIDKDIKGTGFLYSPQMCCFVTQKENLQKTRRVKLDYNKAAEIRISSLSNKELAKIYNVHVGTIRDVKRNKIWS